MPKLFYISETKFAVIAINGGKSKGTAFRRMTIRKLFFVSETKFAVIAINGGKSKGTAF